MGTFCFGLQSQKPHPTSAKLWTPKPGPTCDWLLVGCLGRASRNGCSCSLLQRLRGRGLLLRLLSCRFGLYLFVLPPTRWTQHSCWRAWGLKQREGRARRGGKDLRLGLPGPKVSPQIPSWSCMRSAKFPAVMCLPGSAPLAQTRAQVGHTEALDCTARPQVPCLRAGGVICHALVPSLLRTASHLHGHPSCRTNLARFSRHGN